MTARAPMPGGTATPGATAPDGRPKGRQLPTTPLEERSLGELMATFSRDLSLLIHQEIALAKADLKAGATKAAAGGGALAVAIGALLLAVPFLSVAAAFGFQALGLTLGWSFLVVGGAYLLLGLFVAAVAGLLLRKAKPPKRAMTSVKADLQVLSRKPPAAEVEVRG